MEKVDIFAAFSWICPTCGKRNFVRGVTIERTAEDDKVLRSELGLSEWEDLPEEMCDLIMAPSVVKCKHCSERFEVNEPA